jgi:hypothetical protein
MIRRPNLLTRLWRWLTGPGPILRSDPLESRIIRALAANPDLSGADLSIVLHVSSGRLYPALAGLEQSGRITSKWQLCGKTSRRRIYRLAAHDISERVSSRIYTDEEFAERWRVP